MTYSWQPLDNAAKIFPAVTTDEHTTVFRISVRLEHRVNYSRLRQAIHIVEERFPYFKVCLRKGFFWYYLEHEERPIIPVADKKGICRAFKVSIAQNPVLFRVLAVRNQISIEFSHVLTDGSGGMQFVRAFLMAYFGENGENTAKGIKEKFMEIPMKDQEFEDAYGRYFKSDIPPVIKHSKAFHLPFKLNNKPRFKVMVFLILMDRIRDRSKELEISITDYLVSVYLYVLQQIHRELPRYNPGKKRKILRIQVPVNLRKIYSTMTLRNFSLFVLPEIDLRLGQYTFEEIVKIVHYKMKLETDQKLINKIITRNVGSEKNLLVRGMPLFIKDLVLHYKYYSQGANQYSGVITNLGKIELPEYVSEKISHLIFIPPPPNTKLKINCGVVGFKNQLTISFGNISRERDLEMKFIRFLTQDKVPVKMMTY